jgi:hypothetical protein
MIKRTARGSAKLNPSGDFSSKKENRVKRR